MTTKKPSKFRASTYIDKGMRDYIKKEAVLKLSTETHVMRVLLAEAIQARGKKA